MLQTHESPRALDKSLPIEEEAGLVETAFYVLGIVRHQALVIASVALIVMSLGVIYLWVTPPTFTAKTQIFIDRGKSAFLQQQTVLPDAPIDSAQVESQIQILASERVAMAVVKNLHLTEDPEFAGSGGGFFGFKAKSAPPSEAHGIEQAALALLKNLQVNRIGIAFILEISYRSHSPERAAQIANAITEAYIFDQMDSKYKMQLRATEWLQTRLTELRQQAATSEEAVNAFKTKNNIVAAGGTNINDQEVGELNRQLVEARAKTADAQARLNRIEQVLRCADVGGRSKENRAAGDFCVDAAGSDGSGAVSDILSNPIVTKLRQQYLELVNREAEISTRYGHEHAAAVNFRNQIRDTQSSVLNEVRRLAESYKSDYLISKQRQDSLEKDLAKSVAQSQETSKTQATLRELESNAQSARSVYEVFLQRYTESLQQQTNVTTEVRVVAPAIPPPQPSSPKSVLVLALSVIGGLGAGMGVALLRTMTDRVFRTAGQIESVLHVPCIALVNCR
jgi:succinoglycan biosynthesis transport protein ExoP